MHATTQNTCTSSSTNASSGSTNTKAKRQGDAQRAAHAATASVLDACAFSGIGRSTLYKKAAAGHLLLVKIGSRSLVDMASLRDMIAKLPEAKLRKPAA